MAEEKPLSRTKDVDPEDQISALKRYIESGRSCYNDNSIIVDITRAAIRKARQRGVNICRFEEELRELETPAKIRYLEDGIRRLEDHKNDKASMPEKRAIELVRSISAKLKALEEKGIDVSVLRERFNNIQGLK